MLGFIQGKILTKNIDTSTCVLLAGGVGYEITLSKKTFEWVLPNIEYPLWLHTHVREDALVLFGFLSETEKLFFRVLLGVSGLGPKTALSLLSEHGAEKLSRLIIDKNIRDISLAPGVGKKLAERLILELASKVEKLHWVTQMEKLSEEIGTRMQPKPPHLRDDLNSALVNLGYQQNQIKPALDRLFEQKGHEALDGKPDFESGLKFALSQISGRGSQGEGNRAGNA